MQQIVIRGGNPLHGRVEISGAKNAALPLMVATLLTDGPCELANVPALGDIQTISTLLQGLGVRVQRLGRRQDALKCRIAYWLGGSI